VNFLHQPYIQNSEQFACTTIEIPVYFNDLSVSIGRKKKCVRYQRRKAADGGDRARQSLFGVLSQAVRDSPEYAHRESAGHPFWFSYFSYNTCALLWLSPHILDIVSVKEYTQEEIEGV
jgi:hypothetical protein